VQVISSRVCFWTRWVTEEVLSLGLWGILQSILERIGMVEMKSQDGAGFDFELCKRNAYLQTKGIEALSPTKTGTTICGMIFKVYDICVTPVLPGGTRLISS
jgi:hypothetical protein